MRKKHIDEVRAFNRFYTRVIGLLDKHILDSKYSLPEVRIMYELYHNPGCTSKEIIDELNIDKGYFSRILLSFQKSGLIKKQVSKSDGRSQMLSLSKKGEAEFLKLNETQNEQVKNILEKLPVDKREELVTHMTEIKNILSDI